MHDPNNEISVVQVNRLKFPAAHVMSRMESVGGEVRSMDGLTGTTQPGTFAAPPARIGILQRSNFSVLPVPRIGSAL